MSSKYGIAEWFGVDVTVMSEEQRVHAALSALGQKDEEDFVPPECPFMQALQPGAPCNKTGGVCSIRRYAATSDGNAEAVAEQPVTVCPSRFRERHGDADVFSTIGSMLYADEHPLVIKEVPFLQKRNAPAGKGKAGRIDWIVLPGDSAAHTDPRWTAVETQAIYFSGDNIWLDVDDYLANPQDVRLPVGNRRPDYRSSGPKRLSPQLDVKAPRIGRWGKNTIVVVDEYFWSQMPGLDESKKLDPANDEVIWLVLRYDADMHLKFSKAIGATMVESRDALSGTDVMDKAKFTGELVDLLNGSPRGKVFKL